MSFPRPILQRWHFPVPSLSGFRPPFPSSLQACAQFRASSLFLSSSSLFDRLCSSTQPLSFQVLNGVRKEQLETAGVREGRSRGSRRPYTKQAPQTEQAVPDMGKKEKPVGPKKLSLRNVMTNPSSTISFVQILGTGMDTGDTSACVLLFFYQRRYIFNAGEGLQRF